MAQAEGAIRRATTRPPKLRALCAEPRLYVAERFATDVEIAHILAVAGNPRALARRGVEETTRDHRGFAFEMPVPGDRVMERLARRITAVTRVENALGDIMRFRRYGVGEYHKLHTDAYTHEDLTLVVTAMVYLTDTPAGGETHFPEASPAPLKIAPRRGRLAVWFSHTPDGKADPRAVHESLPVVAGQKATITSFIYAPLSAAATRLDSD